MIKIICVCGARPNFMKVAPVMKAFKANGNFQTLLVHTGQHYDENMIRQITMTISSSLSAVSRAVNKAGDSEPSNTAMVVL